MTDCYTPPWLTYRELWEAVGECAGAGCPFPPAIVIASERALRLGWGLGASAQASASAQLHLHYGEIGMRPGGLVLVALRDAALHVMEVRQGPVDGPDPVVAATEVMCQVEELVWVLRYGDGGWTLCLADSVRALRFGPFVVTPRVDRRWARDLLVRAHPHATGLVCGTTTALEELERFGCERWAAPGRIDDPRRGPGWTVVCTDADPDYPTVGRLPLPADVLAPADHAERVSGAHRDLVVFLPRTDGWHAWIAGGPASFLKAVAAIAGQRA